MPSLLLIEDDEVAARALSDHLERAGHTVAIVRTAEEGLETLRREIVDVVVTDLQLPGMSGLDFLREAKTDDGPPIIVVTGDADVTSAVQAMRAGAADYVQKPLTGKSLDRVATRVFETARLRRQVARMARGDDGDPNPETTSRSDAMRRLLDLARRTAESGTTAALIVGESGVGKEVLAAYMHRASPRAHAPFLRVNVAAIPDTMVEAELFGATRGAFTDAKRDRQGFFSASDTGTLLLDEIGELRSEMQAKLLRAIETRRFYPVGATREVASDVRILAATNRDPAEAVSSGRLRADLYYRLATVVLRIPPLRERREDIPDLVSWMLRAHRRVTGRGPVDVERAAMTALAAYAWPGNVRELRNAMERLAMLVETPTVNERDLEMCGIFAGVGGYAVKTRDTDGANVRDTRPTEQMDRPPPLDPGFPIDGSAPSLETVARRAADEAERRYIVAVLDHVRGNKTKAAEILRISRSTLWQKLRRFSLATGES